MTKLALQDERGFNQIFAPVGSTLMRMQRRNDWFAAQIKRVGAQRVLELGCGTGETAAYLAEKTGADISAVDISERFIVEARNRHRIRNVHFEVFDLLGDAKLSASAFDMVYGNGILHHLVAHLPRVLRSLRSVTASGGGIAFIEPNFLNPYCTFIFGTRLGRRLACLEPDEMAFTRKQLRDVLHKTAWNEIRVITRDFLVPGIPNWFTKPILMGEPVLEATPLTSWLAQSHFITAMASQPAPRALDRL